MIQLPGFNEGMTDDATAFLESLNKEYPGYTFYVTPIIFNEDTLEMRRAMTVRLPSGELRKLRKSSWNPEQIQDAEVINNPAAASSYENAVLDELRSAIREEMKLIT